MPYSWFVSSQSVQPWLWASVHILAIIYNLVHVYIPSPIRVSVCIIHACTHITSAQVWNLTLWVHNMRVHMYTHNNVRRRSFTIAWFWIKGVKLDSIFWWNRLHLFTYLAWFRVQHSHKEAILQVDLVRGSFWSQHSSLTSSTRPCHKSARSSLFTLPVQYILVTAPDLFLHWSKVPKHDSHITTRNACLWMTSHRTFIVFDCLHLGFMNAWLTSVSSFACIYFTDGCCTLPQLGSFVHNKC